MWEETIEARSCEANWINVLSGGTFKCDARTFSKQPCLKLAEITHLAEHGSGRLRVEPQPSCPLCVSVQFLKCFFFFFPPSGYIIRTQLLHWRALDGCLCFYRAKCGAMLLLIVIRIPGRLDFLSREASAICTEEARHSLRCSPEDLETIHRRWWFQMLRHVALDRCLLWLFPFSLFLCFASLCFSQTEGLLSCLLGALNLTSASNLYVFNPAARSTSFVLPPPWLLKYQGNDVKACLEAQANKLISMCH